MKKCPKCGKEKALVEFHKRAKSKDGLASWCKDCNREGRRAAYRARPQVARDYAKARRIELKSRLLEFLKEKECKDCGESDPVVLDFDHVSGEKRWEVTNMVNSGLSWKTILEEIGKCEIRCANCHRRKTAKRMGSFRLGD